jgi:hypothetical protein
VAILPRNLSGSHLLLPPDAWSSKSHEWLCSGNPCTCHRHGRPCGECVHRPSQGNSQNASSYLPTYVKICQKNVLRNLKKSFDNQHHGRAFQSPTVLSKTPLTVPLSRPTVLGGTGAGSAEVASGVGVVPSVMPPPPSKPKPT